MSCYEGGCRHACCPLSAMCCLLTVNDLTNRIECLNRNEFST